MTQTTINADKVKAYKSTDYCVHAAPGSFTLRVGKYSQPLSDLYRDTRQICGAFITAYNPLGELRDELTNQSAQGRLKEHLLALTPNVYDGEGKDPEGNWPGEPSLFALGLDEIAARLIGEQYRQDAIIWIDQDAIPQLVLLR